MDEAFGAPVDVPELPAPDEREHPDHTLTVEHSHDPAVNLDGGVVFLGGSTEGAVLPARPRVEEASEDTDDPEEAGTL
ncbi:hypothetical protein PJ985_12460 [Streptomyces sp. ACA25]|uniref:hypothetical protein n=1 Tax=Streptomyces sp. ACA25 TaxID=3022596 RepID=UPI002307A000|nr:hypothetical protein [Streptomyces sp. ACA25]MDB1088377.1 hypothetical protein [Streptomyces sp. ACA25]